MPTLGLPILVQGPAGLWLLAHVTSHGIQPTFYNWAGLRAGVAFCAEHDERPAILVDGHRLGPREQDCLAAVDSTGTALALARRLHSSVPAILRCLCILQAAGLARVGAEGGATKGSAEVWLTSAGAALARSLAAPGV